jgi:hypothetical protein
VDKSGKTIREFKGTDRHMQNFIDVVRSRKKSELYGPIEEGHVSSALCHLGNISHRLGHASTGEIGEKTKSSALLTEAHGRMLEHLKANEVDVAKTPLIAGVPLLVDAKRERFKGPHAELANEMLAREYRAPFVVPSITGGSAAAED